ncbi:MAG TPA: ABC transporter permease, partial [Candidatus Dormibacteraeota bacterium]|nr:ABC transporter permease [Candidatus Dormibacteraeota bacterium]
PFDHAFAAANGAQLIVGFDPSTTPSALQATRQAAGVVDAAGPWPTGMLGFAADPADVKKGGSPAYLPFPVSGRSDPGTSVDRMTLSSGRWWQRSGEIVLSQRRAAQFGVSVGDSITAQQLPAPEKLKPGAGNGTGRGGGTTSIGAIPPAGPDAPLATRTFTVVGIAGSVSTPDVFGWLAPADIAALSPAAPLEEQMLYRVSPSATPADLATALSSIGHGLPPGVVSSSQTYLALQDSGNREAAIFVPILLAFALFALLAAAFIIANVVSGIVLASYGAIGVMKSIGFQPSQIVAILLGEILVPAAVGAGAGVAAGTVASQPILDQMALSFGLPSAFTLSGPVVVAVLAAAFAVAILAALGPAVSAGRLSAVTAMARGSAPSGSHGLRGGALRLPLGAPIRLGVATSVAHRLRAAMTFGALVVGVAAVVFSLGLLGSLRVVAADLIRDQASPVRAEIASFVNCMPQIACDDARLSPGDISSAIAGDADTARWVAIGDVHVTLSSLGSIPFVGYQGDSSWLGYPVIQGRWFRAPGEAVAPTNFFTESGLHVGDQVTVASGSRTATLTLVGEIFDQAEENRDDLVLRGEWADLAALTPGLQADRWEMQPRAGVTPSDYHQSLSDATGPGVNWDQISDSGTNEGFLLFEGVIAVLGAVLVVISLGGVLDTALLETRRRARQTAVLKTLGMTPRQVMAMVVASVVPLGLAAGLLGVPIGLLFQREVLAFMGQAAIKTHIPESAYGVFPPVMIVVVGLSGLALAAVGAFVPAQRAARSRIVSVLASE